MSDKKIVKQFFKYLLMFLFTFLLCHVNNVTTEKCILIALGTGTLFLAMDYFAPYYVTDVTDIKLGQCVNQ